MPKITYLASVSDGKISFPSGVLDSTMLSTEVNNTSTNDTIPTSKAVYDSIVKLANQGITDQDGGLHKYADTLDELPNGTNGCIGIVKNGGKPLIYVWIDTAWVLPER